MEGNLGTEMGIITAGFAMGNFLGFFREWNCR
jgi:hypothetical protein